MIKGFRCKETQKLFETGRSEQFGSIVKVATRKLAQREAAETLDFLRSAAMRLARYFGGDARSWLNLQIAHDLRIAELASSKAIQRTVTPMKKAS